MRLLLWVTLVVSSLVCDQAQATVDRPRHVTPCQLASDPGRYDHELIEISGHIEHGFEQFTLSTDACSSGKTLGMGIWLEYGGKRQSQTVYCCADATGPDRKTALTVEGLVTRLTDDDVFARFDALLHRSPAVAVEATVIGRFFAGTRTTINGHSFWGGYGHMGGFSLLIIERVTKAEVARHSSEDDEDVPPAESSAPLPPIDMDRLQH